MMDAMINWGLIYSKGTQHSRDSSPVPGCRALHSVSQCQSHQCTGWSWSVTSSQSRVQERHMSHVYTLSTFCKQRWEAPDIAGSIDILIQKHLCVPCLIQDGKWFTWLTWVSQASVCHSCFPVVPPVSAVTIPVRILHYQLRSSWPSRPCQTNPPVDVSLQRF